ncbi:MAG: 16S rRNA (cytosine(967)-C(5))-methyltransferase RsmB [Oscillospiraceae bacterium]|nr:16S rRNA (cytosine(967)-C(5))-methyltransferase RsmB [Oscillospiraceae bacterium]
MTGREAALSALIKTETTDGYSNLVLDSLFSSADMTDKEKAFAARLFYGCLERRVTIEYTISKYASVPIKKMERKVLMLLIMGLYQIFYMDSVPSSAAVNETVRLAGKQSRGFINAVLRRAVREGGKPLMPEEKDPAYLSVKYGVPKPLCDFWRKAYGGETLLQILEGVTGREDGIFVKINTLKISPEDFLSRLKQLEIPAVLDKEYPDCAVIGTGIAEHHPLVREGLIHVQDRSCRVCCSAVDPKPGERIFDMCAAPGGKSFTLAQMGGPDSRIFSFELHQNRTGLIRQGMERLELGNITPKTNDATLFDPSLGLADKVLCDVPCSGLGVIGKKPEIRFKALEQFASLPELQLRILKTSAQYVRPGGLLVYSTCTLNPAENEDVCHSFLAEDGEFVPHPISVAQGEYMKTIIPDGRQDGFFFATFRKKAES